MNWDTFLWTGLAVALTLCTFSFLYRDNPFYKFSEALFVGVAAGYFTMILWYTGLVPTLFDRLWMDPDQHWYQIWKGGWWTGLVTGRWWYIFPGILGLMMWFRFSKKKSWISRYPIAFYLGIATGAAIPLEMQNRVNRQLADTLFAPDFSVGGLVGIVNGVSDIIIIIGVVCALFYFFFSLAHKGTIGVVAKIGIYILMIGFGASFGYTVMGRISLFIERIQTIRDWVDMGVEGGGGMMAIIWITGLILVLLVLLEIIRHLKNKTVEKPA
jgi:hypothetical protein